MAEFWLEKPVIAINTATYWHALRTMGIQDQDGRLRRAPAPSIELRAPAEVNRPMEYDYIPLPHRQPLKLAGRCAGRPDPDVQSRDLGSDQADHQTLLRRRPGDPARQFCRGIRRTFQISPGASTASGSGIWRLFELFDRARRQGVLHHQRRDVRAAQGDDRRGAGARLGTPDPQLGAGRACLPTSPRTRTRSATSSCAPSPSSRSYTGRKSKGWLSSSACAARCKRPDILAEYGCTFYCDIMNDDQPYL